MEPGTPGDLRTITGTALEGLTSFALVYLRFSHPPSRTHRILLASLFLSLSSAPPVCVIELAVSKCRVIINDAISARLGR